MLLAIAFLLIGFIFVFIAFYDKFDFLIDPVYSALLPTKIRESWVTYNIVTNSSGFDIEFRSDVDADYIVFELRTYDENDKLLGQAFTVVFDIKQGRLNTAALNTDESKIEIASYYRIEFYNGKRA